MTEIITMEGCNHSEVFRTKPNGNNWFVLRGQFLRSLQENISFGFENQDANDHMERVLEVGRLYKTKNMTYNRFMLLVFPYTIAGEAMCWLNKEPRESSWIELKVKFLEKLSLEFTCWLKSKFRYPGKMSSSLKNELWTFWRAGSDEEEIDSEEGELFRIETNLFDYETPLCKEFNEFNYLLKIDTDVLTGDLPGFKTFDAFKNTWLYEWNDQIPWVSNKSVFYDELVHSYEPIRFKDGTCEWPSCDWRNDGICNGGNLIGMTQNGSDISFADYSWYDLVEYGERKNEALQEKARIEGLKELREPKDMTFWEWVHRSFDDYTKLDRRLQWRLQKEWEKLQSDYKSSSEDSYRPIEDVVNDVPESIKENEDELPDGLEDYLVCNKESNFVNEKIESLKKRKCQLLGIPYQEPQTFTAEKFEVIKYSFGPSEEYAAIKITEFNELTRTEEKVTKVYYDIFRIKEEGWHVTRTK